MEIRAALVRERGARFSVESVDLDDPRDDEVLVRIVATGLCHSDVAIRDNIPFPYPAILGHEGAGVVERVGANVTKVKAGDHVVLAYSSCGVCENCLKGRPSYCLTFRQQNMAGCRADGTCTHHQHGQKLWSSFFGQSSFANHALVRQRNLVKVASDLPLEILGPLGCGIQTGAGAVLNTLKPAPGTSIAVFGIGAVGLAAIMAAKLAGCTTIVAVDVKDNRLELAKSLGATHAVNSAAADAIKAIREITGTGVNFVVEATGLPAVMSTCPEALVNTGTALLLGVAPPGAKLEFSAASILQGATIKGVLIGDGMPDVFIPQLIDFYRRGLFPFDRLIKMYALDDINVAVEESKTGVAIKPVIKMD